MGIKNIIKKKRVKIPLTVIGSLLLLLFVADYVLFIPQLPDAGNEFALSDSTKQVIRENVENGKFQSLFVGIVDEDGTDYFYYGNIEKEGLSIDESTIFEIGSVTKVFTSLVLADMVEKGELNLDDPIDKFLPEHVNAPSRNGKNITLLDLATHTSGLPRWPDDFPLTDAEEQLDFDRDEMYDYISNVELSRDIGSQYEYSNIGVSLLGHILSLQSNQSYEDLIKERVFDKFGMKNTCIKQCDSLRDKFANPHLMWFPSSEINLSDDLAGAGEIRSSGKDMLEFLSYAMNLKDSDLINSFKISQEPRQKVDENISVGLGWHTTQKDSQTVIWHNGATNGFASFVGFDPESNHGVVVLTNTLNIVDEIGFWILDHGK